MNDYWREVFGWSVSRQGLWDECMLAYYYRYIARWEGHKGDPFRERMRFLGALKKLVFVKGQYIHDAIQSQVDHRYMGRPVNAEAAQNLYRMSIEKVMRYPKQHLVEAFNGIGVEDEEFANLLEQGREQLERFFSVIWPSYDELEYLRHERFDSFELRGVKVNVKIDLASRNDRGEVVITDWKTGKEWGEPSENLQMSTYIMWACHMFKVPLERVKGEIVYLSSGKHVPTIRDQAQVDEAAGLIQSGARDMLSVKGTTDLPGSPSPDRCQVCNFATYCPHGKEVLAGMGLAFSPL